MSKQNFFSSAISLIPLSYILGTFVLNLNILFIILNSLVLFTKGNRFKVITLDKILIVFFSYIIITSFYNTAELYLFEKPENYDFTILIKSFLFLRYLLLYFAIRLLIENNLINYKIIFFSFAALSLFVSADVIYQFYNGKDLFGLTSPYPYKITGPFHTEAVAGGFIQRFSFFLFFSFAFFTIITYLRIKILLLTSLFFITILAIILSANRMPMLLFLFGIFLIFLNNKTLKKYILYILISVFIMSTLTIGTNEKLKNTYYSFYESTKNILSLYSYRITGVGKDLPIHRRPFYIHEFDSGYGTWKMNKYIGGGLKSFRYNCPKRDIKAKINIPGKGESVTHERTTCNMHPHNYYLEILTDLGIVGLLLFFPIVFYAIKNSYKALHSENQKYFISPFFYIFIMEVFPIKSSGSFFTTNNSVIIFLTLAMIVGLSSKYKKEYS